MAPIRSLLQGKPNLALCSYQHCVSGRDSTLTVLPALQSCVAVFKHVGNATAEYQTRELLTKVQKSWCSLLTAAQSNCALRL